MRLADTVEVNDGLDKTWTRARTTRRCCWPHRASRKTTRGHTQARGEIEVQRVGRMRCWAIGWLGGLIRQGWKSQSFSQTPSMKIKKYRHSNKYSGPSTSGQCPTVKETFQNTFLKQINYAKLSLEFSTLPRHTGSYWPGLSVQCLFVQMFQCFFFFASFSIKIWFYILRFLTTNYFGHVTRSSPLPRRSSIIRLFQLFFSREWASRRHKSRFGTPDFLRHPSFTKSFSTLDNYYLIRN